MREPEEPQSTTSSVFAFLRKESTFFRIHLLAFVTIPLIFSGIFFAANGRFHVKYIDALFLCYSAMTVTGLSTLNLSTLTVAQQLILYFLMCIGDITVVSWIMVLVRMNYFVTKCEYVASRDAEPAQPSALQRTRTALLGAISAPVKAFPLHQPVPDQPKPPPPPSPLRPDIALTQATPFATLTEPRRSPPPDGVRFDHMFAEKPDGAISDAHTFTSSPRAASASLAPSSRSHSRSRSRSSLDAHAGNVPFALSTSLTPSAYLAQQRRAIAGGIPLPGPTLTMMTNRSRGRHAEPAKYRGHGGFPGPVTLAKRALAATAPSAYHKLERRMTIPASVTLNGVDTLNGGGGGNVVRDVLGESKFVSWLKFAGLVVGRNSDFHTEELSDEQLEQLGGTEYRALRLLSYLVPAYFIGTQLIAFLLFAPWLSTTHGYDDVFNAQPRIVKKPWFSLFQVMGAYTGGGLSLVDLGMVPFDSAYLIIFALMFVILAGNHALPIFLRFIIWIGSTMFPKHSELGQTLSFLLDHPRRCFVYLFPSHQTWFLVICLVFFSIIEWVSFAVLDIGLDVYDQLPTGPRIVAGLFQGLAARASGFAIVPVSALAPSVQFLYVVMMYIAVYPVAMSIRTTNVYEERSLGVFEVPPDDEDEEPTDLAKFSRRERLGRYLGWHLRRQISNDIWWLVWGVFLVAIIERDSLLDESKKWFDLFRVLFELVSAFAGIGLSLGFPSDNFSFAGTMRPLSKLVIIVIMVRGRHRGLPVAVDRAVLLPSEMVTTSAPAGEKALGENLGAEGAV